MAAWFHFALYLASLQLMLIVISGLQKYRLYLKRMSGLHPGANGRKGGGKGSSGPQDANFQVQYLEDLSPQCLMHIL